MSQTEQPPELATTMKADERRLAAVASLAGLSRGMLSKIERGVSSPSLSTLTAVAAALNVPLTNTACSATAYAAI